MNGLERASTLGMGEGAIPQTFLGKKKTEPKSKYPPCYDSLKSHLHRRRGSIRPRTECPDGCPGSRHVSPAPFSRITPRTLGCRGASRWPWPIAPARPSGAEGGVLVPPEHEVVVGRLRLLDANQRDGSLIPAPERPPRQFQAIGVEPRSRPEQPPLLQGKGSDAKGYVVGGEEHGSDRHSVRAW